MIRQQIPNIPWTYYDTIQMPISDHALVLLGIRWRIGAPDPPHKKPQPTVTKWYTTHCQRFTNTISTLPVKNTDPPLHTAWRILSAIAHAARPRQPARTKTSATATWSETTDPKARLREYGETQEQHIRRQIGKLRRAAVHRSGYFYKMVKRWRTGLIAQDTPQRPIGGTQYVLNHFVGDPTYDEDACRRLIRKHVRHHTWNTTLPTYEEYLRCLRAPKNKSAGPDGVPPHLLRHLPNHIQQQLYQATIAVWNGQNIPVAWLQSRVVLIYKKKDPQDPGNYRPIYVSTAIYSILTRLLLTRISRAMTPGLLDIQHGATQGRNTTTLATKLLNDLHTQDGYVALLDVAKAFPSVPRPMLTGMVKEAGAPENIIRMLGEIYQHPPAVLTLHGKDLPIRPTRGMKEGCPLSPTLFLLYYDILLRETKERCPGAQLYVFVDDIAVRAPTKEALLHTLDTLHHVAYTMGLRFNKDKTEVYHWAKDYNLTPITWQHQLIPVRPPIMTYLGHVLAHPTQEDTAWDMVTTQLHHDVAAYRTLPLNAYEKVAIINAVLIPRSTYKGLFLGNRTRMAHWDDILLQFITDTLGIEQQMNKHRLTTNLSQGGLGLRQLWWSYITRWVTIGQQELQNNGPTQQLTATQYKYIDAVRALGGTVGQRISQPRQHRPLSAGLYDSKSLEEDQETHTGKTRPATNRLDYGWMNPPNEPTPEETHEVCQALPHLQKIHRITVHYTGEPTTTRWYTDGSKRHGRAKGVYTTGPTARLSGCTGHNRCIEPRQSLALWPLNWPNQGTTLY